MKTLSQISIIVLSVILVSCSTITRTEKDTFRITDSDTTFKYTVKNAPGNRDNGVVFPSSRTLLKESGQVQHDSTVERDYPDFIRLGLLETVGIVGSSSEYGIGTGLFGIFPEFKNLDNQYRGINSSTIPGGIYRLGIAEYRLRWFQDSPNWTLGTYLFETLMPNAKGEDAVIGILPIYVKKRYFIREEIPYLDFAPSLGIGLYPSMYLNFSGALEFGSLGGLNLRAYAGLVAGYNPRWSPQIRNNDFVSDPQSTVFPYFGLGISFLDFHNLPKETEKEWKYHEHSSWDVGFGQFSLLHNTSKFSAFGNNDSNALIKGFILKLLNSDIAIPYLNNKFYAGASFMSIYSMGYNEWCMGILPLRVGYWHQLLKDELSVSPFIEVAFYPSYYFNLGAKLNLVLSSNLNLALNAGYITADPVGGIGSDLLNQFGKFQTFSKVYIGLGLSIFDRIFYPEQLRYNK